MEQKQILVRLQGIFRDIFDNEEIVLAPVTTANDIDDWDSLSHIQLIVAIEKNFNIKFSSKEILSWNNIQEMINSIVSKDVK